MRCGMPSLFAWPRPRCSSRQPTSSTSATVSWLRQPPVAHLSEPGRVFPDLGATHLRAGRLRTQGE
eukprot:5955238-Alexandrium_andersonii.AAC.1